MTQKKSWDFQNWKSPPASLKMVNTEDKPFRWMWHQKKVKAGDTIKAEVQTRGRNNPYRAALNISGVKVSNGFAVIKKRKWDWTKLEAEGTATKGGTLWIHLICGRPNKEKSLVWFDDLKVWRNGTLIYTHAMDPLFDKIVKIKERLPSPV